MTSTPIGWERIWDWNYTNAFRLYFEKNRANHKIALISALRTLPPGRARIEYLEDFPGPELIVMFTRNLDNDGASLNETWLMSILVETQALTFFGIEGACGAFNFGPYRNWPDPRVTCEIAKRFLQNNTIDPAEYVGIASKRPMTVWGIEDVPLYLAAIEAHKRGTSDYYDIIARRPPCLLSNIRKKMNEDNLSVGGAALCEYNFHEIAALLRKDKIAHIGVRSIDVGESDWGRVDRKLRGQFSSEDQLRQAIFSGKRGLRTWLKTVGRKITEKIGEQVITKRRLYWYSKWLDRLAWVAQPFVAIVKFFRRIDIELRGLFRPFEKNFSEYARALGIHTKPESCGVCGAVFTIPENAVAVPIEMQIPIDIGGYCAMCAALVCDRHVEELEVKIDGHRYIIAGCAMCGEVLAGFSQM